MRAISAASGSTWRPPVLHDTISRTRGAAALPSVIGGSGHDFKANCGGTRPAASAETRTIKTGKLTRQVYSISLANICPWSGTVSINRLPGVGLAFRANHFPVQLDFNISRRAVTAWWQRQYHRLLRDRGLARGAARGGLIAGDRSSTRTRRFMNKGSAPARLIHTGSRGKSALVSPTRAGGTAVGSRGMVTSLLPTVGHNVKRWPRDSDQKKLAATRDTAGSS